MTLPRNLPLFLAGAALLATGGATVSQQAPGIDQALPPPSNNYPLGPDSQAHSSVKAGKTFTFTLADSKIFPGTSREITVYVPAEYKGAKATCVYVGLDGLLFNAPTVFDNLIAQHAMPMTIAIGVAPGVVPSADTPDNPRFDRSFEFDSRNDRLGRFLLEEVLPDVERHRTPDGFPILLSQDPNDRAIGGGSTGGIGAFTVAWEHPDAFRRVFSAIGTYVGMRGGEQYYVLVRKTEPRPLRIFLQDGVHDEWLGGPEMGDWWMSNQTMNRALEFAGYDVRHIWGTGTHDGSQAASVFPDAMRWLWRDWPSPVKAAEPGNPVLKAILDPENGWQSAAETCSSVAQIASNPRGEVFLRIPGAQELSPLDLNEAHRHPCPPSDAVTEAFALGAHGEVYLARAEGGVNVTPKEGTSGAAPILAPNLRVLTFAVRPDGDLYASTQSPSGEGELWLVRSTGGVERLGALPKAASGLALTPDGLWLFVSQSASRTGWSYRIRHDGTIDAGEPLYNFYAPGWTDQSGAGQIAMDRDGRAYVATRMGVQVFDRNGRVTAILPLPGNQAATGICFGGTDFNILYVAAGPKIYRRKLHVIGFPPWSAPLRLPAGSAG